MGIALVAGSILVPKPAAGITAFKIFLRLGTTRPRELAGYKPDLCLVYADSNEVVGPYGPGMVLTAGSLSLPLIHASIFVRSSRIGQLSVETGKQRAEWYGMEMFLSKQVRADSPRTAAACRNFAANPKETVRVAHDSGAHALLSTRERHGKHSDDRQRHRSRFRQLYPNGLLRNNAFQQQRLHGDAALGYSARQCHWHLLRHAENCGVRTITVTDTANALPRSGKVPLPERTGVHDRSGPVQPYRESRGTRSSTSSRAIEAL